MFWTSRFAFIGTLGRVCSRASYEVVLAERLQNMGYKVDRQRAVDIEFEGVRFAAAFRADLIVDHRLVVEIKSVEHLLSVHGKQLLTYLRLLRQPVGLLINFGSETLKEGVRRVVNGHRPSASPRLRVNQPSSGA